MGHGSYSLVSTIDVSHLEHIRKPKSFSRDFVTKENYFTRKDCLADNDCIGSMRGSGRVIQALPAQNGINKMKVAHGHLLFGFKLNIY